MHPAAVPQPARPLPVPSRATGVLSRVAAVVGLLQCLAAVITFGSFVRSYLQQLNNVGVSESRRISDAEIAAGEQAITSWAVVWVVLVGAQIVLDVLVMVGCRRLRRFPPMLRGQAGLVFWLSIVATPVTGACGALASLATWSAMQPSSGGGSVLAALGPMIGFWFVVLAVIGVPLIRIAQLLLRVGPRRMERTA